MSSDGDFCLPAENCMPIIRTAEAETTRQCNDFLRHKLENTSMIRSYLKSNVYEVIRPRRGIFNKLHLNVKSNNHSFLGVIKKRFLKENQMIKRSNDTQTLFPFLWCFNYFLGGKAHFLSDVYCASKLAAAQRIITCKQMDPLLFFNVITCSLENGDVELHHLRW